MLQRQIQQPKVSFVSTNSEEDHRVLQLHKTKCCSLIKYMNANKPVEVPDPSQKRHG